MYFGALVGEYYFIEHHNILEVTAGGRLRWIGHVRKNPGNRF
jgi:hypothetical protein